MDCGAEVGVGVEVDFHMVDDAGVEVEVGGNRNGTVFHDVTPLV